MRLDRVVRALMLPTAASHATPCNVAVLATIKRLLSNPQFAGNVGYRCAGFVLHHCRNDLFDGVPFARHLAPFYPGQGGSESTSYLAPFLGNPTTRAVTGTFVVSVANEECLRFGGLVRFFHAWPCGENDNARTSSELAATQDPTTRMPIFCHAFLFE